VGVSLFYDVDWNERLSSTFGFSMQDINLDAPPPPASEAAAMFDHVIYENKRPLVVNKPSGLAVHGGSGVSHGVIELLRHARPDLRDLSLVHRLDREMSGCLVLAKKRSAFRALHEKFREGIVEKNYLALVAGSATGSSTDHYSSEIAKAVSVMSSSAPRANRRGPGCVCRALSVGPVSSSVCR